MRRIKARMDDTPSRKPIITDTSIKILTIPSMWKDVAKALLIMQ